MLIRLGVLGWPVAHSLSPRIQNAALRAAGLDDWHYQLLPVPPELFTETVGGLPRAGFRGANVTIPHKQAALALATSATPRAAAIGAANTLVFSDNGTVAADNTDAPALIAALGASAAGSSALVLGAGGSARAAVWALRDAGAAAVRIWNRSPERARRLAADFDADAVTTAQLSGAARGELLVNCTTVGLDGNASLEGLPIRDADLNAFETVVDFVYRPGDTALVRAARARGVSVVDGLTLLIGQGALAFERFTGRAAPVAAMWAAVAPRPRPAASTFRRDE